MVGHVGHRLGTFSLLFYNVVVNLPNLPNLKGL